ncbi:MAG: NAD-dependent epimerase/dehydratase family protein [Saprospiraceae bacterium]|nr:NAD-dependent epimerase/dehydratase family protein [Saprospiraceae bacterium]
MQIAITGGTGHIGAAVVRVLAAEGHTLRALVRKDTRALDGLDIDMIQGDLLDPGAVDRLVAGCEVVIHLAAKISLDGDRHGDVHRTNVDGTRLVLDACTRHQVRRIIHFASVHAFQTPQPGALFDESLPLAGPAQFAYERSKGKPCVWFWNEVARAPGNHCPLPHRRDRTLGCQTFPAGQDADRPVERTSAGFTPGWV